MTSLIPSIVVLGLAAAYALVLARSRPSPDDASIERAAAARVLGLAVVIQGVHFIEEAVNGFPERLGSLFGLPAMPSSFFVLFNLAWLGFWVASVRGVRLGWTVAFFAAWFLAIAATVNGVAHPLLAAASGGYFPGLVSSPLIGAVGVWLWIRLRRATQPM